MKKAIPLFLLAVACFAEDKTGVTGATNPGEQKSKLHPISELGFERLSRTQAQVDLIRLKAQQEAAPVLAEQQETFKKECAAAGIVDTPIETCKGDLTWTDPKTGKVVGAVWAEPVAKPAAALAK